MVKRRSLRLISLLLVVVILTSVFLTGCNTGKTVSQPTPVSAEGLEVVEEAWHLIFSDYVDKEKLDKKKLSQAAIRGMIEALDDPYSSYLDAEHYKLGMSSLEGEIEGIGAQVGMRDERLTVIAPIADSPAAKAGIRAGDVILEVDGKPTAKMSLTEAVLNIRGPKGTSVRLLILHQGETEPKEIVVVRAKIELASVSFEMREEIGYISITHFSERTNDELIPVLGRISEQKASGIILDLRNNSGGVLDEVVDVASNFLSGGVVVKVVNNKGESNTLKVRPGKRTIGLPMVVLVDNTTASGSEVLAGALQDYKRATIAGTKTFGKGSVNFLRQLKDGSGLFLTSARWLTPNGRVIEGQGIKPDYELELKGEEAIKWAIDYLRSQKQGSGGARYGQ